MKVNLDSIQFKNYKISQAKTGPKVKAKNGKCIVCNTIVNDDNYNSSLGSNFCSWPCYEQYKQDNTTPNCTCSICNKPMYMKPSRLNRVKTSITCSKECTYKLKKTSMSGENNHQYGLKGHLNASFIGEDKINQYGYNMKYLPNHPLADKHGRYREHRFKIEQDLNQSEEYFDYIGEHRVLKEEYEVHHINEDKLDNRIENLQVVTKGIHRTIHNLQREYIRDDKGRIIGVVKQGELLENLGEDNQQPSNDSNIIKGSTTNSQVQTDKAEDGNTDTSALQLKLF